jgi:hypothetical protein
LLNHSKGAEAKQAPGFQAAAAVKVILPQQVGTEAVNKCLVYQVKSDFQWRLRLKYHHSKRNRMSVPNSRWRLVTSSARRGGGHPQRGNSFTGGHAVGPEH